MTRWSRIGRPKTNNNVNGNNKKINNFAGRAKPNIYGAITLLKSEELTTSIKYAKSLADPTKKTIRRKLDIDKENKLKSLRDLLE